MAGAAVAVLVLALFHKSRAANSAAAAAAVTDTAGTATGTAIPGGTIGVPGTTVADIQNAVQDQINDDIAALRNANSQQIAAIPRGATGATGKTGATSPVPSLYNLNYIAADNGAPLMSAAQYHKIYPTGNASISATQAAEIHKHQDLTKIRNNRTAAATRKPPAPAPKPKPNPPKPTIKLIPPVSKSIK